MDRLTCTLYFQSKNEDRDEAEDRTRNHLIYHHMKRSELILSNPIETEVVVTKKYMTIDLSQYKAAIKPSFSQSLGLESIPQKM